MNTKTQPTLNQYMDNLDKFLELYLLHKAPQIPSDIKAIIVKYIPFLAVVILILSFPALVTALGLRALFAPFAFFGGLGYGINFSLHSLILLFSMLIVAFSIKGLFRRRLSSWKLIYYSVLLNAVYTFLNFDLPNMVLSTGISLYLLYQIKSHYK